MCAEERRWASSASALRRELSEARELCAQLEARGVEAQAQADAPAAALLAQLAALQRASLERERAHADTARHLAAQLGPSPSRLALRAVSFRATSRKSCTLILDPDFIEFLGRLKADFVY